MIEPTDDQMRAACAELDRNLAMLGIPKKPVYGSGEVQQILGVAQVTFAALCDRWEPEDIADRDPRGLESYRLNSHRRVTYIALADWMARNHSYARATA